MKGISRRRFVKGAVAGGFAATAASRILGKSASSLRALGANEDIRIACIGVHGRGWSHVRAFLDIEGVRVTALCDIDRKVLNGRAKELEKRARDKKKPVKPEKYVDFRKLLENKDIDAVSIATPNHTHSLITYWACVAGKDVYVEKPCSHNVYEGRKIVEAARKYKRIVQHGTQSRSSDSWARQTAAARSGKYGKLLVAKGYCCKPRWSIGFKPFAPPPAYIDFDLWLGPAPLQPYHANLVHYNWHWFWDFGNGEIGNQGVHQTDIARWAIPGSTHPTSVISVGGRIGYKDQGQTPNVQMAVYEYGETLLVFEVCGLVDGRTRRVSNDFIYEAGKVVDGSKFYPKDGGGKTAPLPNVEVHVFPGGPFGNFINCVRSRKKEELNAPFLEGHYSAAICHLGNISYRLGREVTFDDIREPFKQDYANAQWDRLRKHLTENRKLDLKEWKGRIGPLLKFDPETEKFVGAPPQANKLLTRDYRAPFVVPSKV